LIPHIFAKIFSNKFNYILIWSILCHHRPLRSRSKGRRVNISFHFLLRGQKVKNNSPSGKIILDRFPNAHKSTVEMQITSRSDGGLSFAALSAANEKMKPLRSVRLCGDYNYRS